MSKLIQIDSISKGHELWGLPKPKHPLVSVVRETDIRPTVDFRNAKLVINLFQIYLKSDCGIDMTYGRNIYDYEDGTLVFISPGQTIQLDGDYRHNTESKGWMLMFHPDLIRKSNLGKNIDNYTFFEYESNEALHLSDDERQSIEDIRDKIIKEYSQNLDRHSQHLIVSNIELMLDYCIRFYDRQFYTRTNINSDVVTRFEKLLKDYYKEKKTIELGVPTVGYCGERLNISPNYLSDLLKKETGKNAKEHIQLSVLKRAKNNLLNSEESISEIAYGLGFEYPQHFSNFFKTKTGLSPRQFRNLN